MKGTLGLLTLAFFVLGFTIPVIWADTEAETGSETWGGATKDKFIRGVENGLFGMGAELYHHIDTQSDEGVVKGWTVGLVEGAHRGLLRTVVGAYELVTPFYHDEAVLSDIDTIVA